MKLLSNFGRAFLALAIACFGIHYIYFAALAGTDALAIPGPPWFPLGRGLAYIAGAGLLAAGISIASGWKSRWSAPLLSAALILRVLIIHLPKLLTNIHDPGLWTSGAEILSIAGGVMVLSALSNDRIASSHRFTLRIGQILFALPLIVVGVQHFLYANFIATLIPSWIPGHLFWAYFVGVAFFASTLAIVFRRAVPLAPGLLGLMFFLWVVMLHLPRVIASAHNGSEWTSMFVALAMSGGALAVAASFDRRA
jgi:uncharacterized membrane protein